MCFNSHITFHLQLPIIKICILQSFLTSVSYKQGNHSLQFNSYCMQTTFVLRTKRMCVRFPTQSQVCVSDSQHSHTYVCQIPNTVTCMCVRFPTQSQVCVSDSQHSHTYVCQIPNTVTSMCVRFPTQSHVCVSDSQHSHTYVCQIPNTVTLSPSPTTANRHG
jgi:hypothetical protein